MIKSFCCLTIGVSLVATPMFFIVDLLKGLLLILVFLIGLIAISHGYELVRESRRLPIRSLK